MYEQFRGNFFTEIVPSTLCHGQKSLTTAQPALRKDGKITVNTVLHVINITILAWQTLVR